jgi:hypothetical protein
MTMGQYAVCHQARGGGWRSDPYASESDAVALDTGGHRALALLGYMVALAVVPFCDWRHGWR